VARFNFAVATKAKDGFHSFVPNISIVKAPQAKRQVRKQIPYHAHLKTVNHLNDGVAGEGGRSSFRREIAKPAFIGAGTKIGARQQGRCSRKLTE
jgi:hypothetical protein